MHGVRHGAATATGQRRRVNEDSLLVAPPLFAVADGMGGHAAGDVASRTVVQVLSACAGSGRVTVDSVLRALGKANAAVTNAALLGEGSVGMGTTVAGLAVLDGGMGRHVMVFNIGDSRVYRFAGHGAEQITVDHSEVQELVAAGLLSAHEARRHPGRNIVTRALGSDPPPLADHWLLPAAADDRYLVCSDGLFNELADTDISTLLRIEDPGDAAAALVAAADKAGGHDNITAVVVDLDNIGDAEADETTTPRNLLPRLP